MKKSSIEFRQMQRERIIGNKPWLMSTGAKTAKGKAKAKMNALKISPELNELIKESKRLFKMQRKLHKNIL